MAAEAALAWVGNVLFLVGCVVMLVWLDWRLALLTGAVMPLSLWRAGALSRGGSKRAWPTLRQRSADIGSFLIETLQATTLIVSSNAQERESGRFRRLNDAFIDALMGMQRVSYLAGGLPGMLLSLGASAVFLYGGWRVVEGTLTLGTFAAFIAYQMRVIAPVQALMGLYTAAGHGQGVVASRAGIARRAGRRAGGGRRRRRSTTCAATLAFEHVSLDDRPRRRASSTT